MLKEIVRPVFQLLWPVFLMFILFVLFAVFRFDRYIFDFTGEFRRSCRALNNKELNAELINKVPGKISRYFNDIPTKDVKESHIAGYKQYMKEQKTCNTVSMYGKGCDDIYDFFGIYRVGFTEDWRCYVTVDPNTYIMTAEPDYYTD